MGVEDEVDAPVGLEGPHVEVVERPDLLDPDHLPQRLDHAQIGVRSRVDPARIAEQRAGEGTRRPRFPTPAGPWKR